MDKFEFFFALLSLLLGLALTQLAGGIASAIKLRSRIAIGWLTPLTALVLCLDIASFWPSLWDVRFNVEIDMPHILIGVGMCLTYYVAASLTFPDDMKEADNLDDWFFAYRRLSLGGTLLVAFLFTALRAGLSPDQFTGLGPFEILWSYNRWILYIALLLCGMFSRSKRVCGAALASIVALYVIFAIF